MDKMPEISVVVPVYKEEGNIKLFLNRIEPILEKIGEYEIIFCADPSPDSTEQIIEKEIKRNTRISMIVFSRRFGQPQASMAGILNCNGKNCVVIDVDMQDPPEIIEQMHEKLQEGYEVVYAKRRSRKGETIPKLIISYIGYKIINRIADVHIPRNTGDFRIMTRRVIEHLRILNESHGFLRGLVAYIGLKQGFVEYNREQRYSGKGNYNRFFGSLKIGLNGLVSYSNFLLSLSSLMGLIIIGINFLIIMYMVITKLVLHHAYPTGIPAIICLVLFMGGIQLISLGIIGEYLGRIYDEVKRRPKYIIDRIVNLKKSEYAGEVELQKQGEKINVKV
ncbi:glycosyltransferase family 2 protein [bacterium]